MPNHKKHRFGGVRRHDTNVGMLRLPDPENLVCETLADGADTLEIEFNNFEFLEAAYNPACLPAFISPRTTSSDRFRLRRIRCWRREDFRISSGEARSDNM